MAVPKNKKQNSLTFIRKGEGRMEEKKRRMKEKKDKKKKKEEKERKKEKEKRKIK